MTSPDGASNARMAEAALLGMEAVPPTFAPPFRKKAWAPTS
eukprot:CAMPEP_0185912094 /NCGR_PEP_ID=MMETSP0196C-20130402/36315_1 /TAXON_ID=2932 /ORGANISM="Alexandrium fundyense, Strain CCMP1719" /LENGTH=40 /DNA_ID= /DNA_START= /DNA_END= /DNA_ORIENTATION=